MTKSILPKSLTPVKIHGTLKPALEISQAAHNIIEKTYSSAKDVFVPEITANNNLEKPAPLFKLTNQTPMSASEQRYYQLALKKGAPTYEMPPIKSPTHTFNHTHEFVIKDGFLWFRIQGNSLFLPLFFDGYPHVAPIMIDSDGANLIVVDNNHQIHYKKILEEFRREEVDAIHRQEIEQAGFSLDECPYVAFDICEVNNWQPVWFSLPVASSIVNFFSKSRLTVPDDAQAVTISQRGRYNNYVADCIGQHHPVGTGVTTLYVLSQNGQDIHKFDPWSPPWAHTTIGLQETHNKSFVGNNISASASTIMAIGYNVDHASKEMIPMVLTRMADIDTMGSNPGIKSSFSQNHHQKETRILPIDADWTKHPFALKGAAMVTKNITIRQTGEGNDARQLRVLGTNEAGEWGYYHKMIADTVWAFKKTNKPHIEESPLKPLSTLPTHSSVREYHGFVNAYPMLLSDFGPRSSHATITITINDKDHRIDLYKRWGFTTFLGLENYVYDMVVNSDEPFLKEIFGNEKTFEVKVKETKHGVTIKPHAFSLHSLVFQPL